MSSNNIIERILSDARQLTCRLKDRDRQADQMITSTMNVQSKLNAMKQFQDVVAKLNETARHRSRMQLIQYLAKENNKIKELEQENSDLRQSLEEHQATLEVIMTKYREQVERLNATTELESAYLHGNKDFSQELQEKDEKIKEMGAVMWMASEHWEDDKKGEEEEQRRRLIDTLLRKNRMLREVLLDASTSLTPDSETKSALNSRKADDEGAVAQDQRRLHGGTEREAIDSDGDTPLPSPVLSKRGKPWVNDDNGIGNAIPYVNNCNDIDDSSTSLLDLTL